MNPSLHSKHSGGGYRTAYLHKGWNAQGDMKPGQSPSCVLHRMHVAGTVHKLVHTKIISL